MKKKIQLKVQILQLGDIKWNILFLISFSGFKKEKKSVEMKNCAIRFCKCLYVLSVLLDWLLSDKELYFSL